MKIQKRGIDGNLYTYVDGQWLVTPEEGKWTSLNVVKVGEKTPTPKFVKPVGWTGPIPAAVKAIETEVGPGGDTNFLNTILKLYKEKLSPKEARFIGKLYHDVKETPRGNAIGLNAQTQYNATGTTAADDVQRAKISFFRSSPNPLTALHENNHNLMSKPLYRPEIRPGVEDNNKVLLRMMRSHDKEFINLGEKLPNLKYMMEPYVGDREAILDLEWRANRMKAVGRYGSKRGRLPNWMEESGMDTGAVAKMWPSFMEEEAPGIAADFRKIKAILPFLSKVGAGAGIGLLAADMADAYSTPKEAYNESVDKPSLLTTSDLPNYVKKAILALREKKRRSLPPSTIGTADSPYMLPVSK